MKGQINSNSVCVVSGGGKGIAAQAAIKLAQHYQCKFVLLGRSSITESEPQWAQGCWSESELKQRILEYHWQQGEKPKPVQVQKEYKAIVSQREIRQTLQAIEQAGGQAEYLSVDITDAIALQEKLPSVTERWGTVEVIIHGAGNLADKPIERKSEQDFDTVYAPKVQGLENLLRCVDPGQLSYLVLFSSVVGLYGNAGQTDYAIANEILNKSAYLIKQHHPHCHVVAINWGPWDSGMVSPELKKAFAQRKIETIPVAIGTQMLVDELSPTNRDTVQVVIGTSLSPPPIPLNSQLKSFRLHRRLSLAANPFLQDHVIAGRPVLPATCAMAWITNACEQLYPGYQFFSCQNFKVLKGIVFDEDLASEYTLDLQEIAKETCKYIKLDAKIWSKNKKGKVRYHFSTQLQLRQQIPESPPSYESISIPPDQSIKFPKPFYQNGATSLFHGPSFQGVESVLTLTPEKINLQCAWVGIGEKLQGQFPLKTFNPYIVDIQIHSLWIWMQHFYKQACLPSEIASFEQFSTIHPQQTFYVACEVIKKTETAAIANIIAHNVDGKIYSRMLGARATIIPISEQEYKRTPNAEKVNL